MAKERTIIHIDLDAFFCAVEEQRDRTLAGKPFAVGGRPDARGVVSSCSYSARLFGIHSAMPMAKALQLCRNLVIKPPNFSAYKMASKQVMTHLRGLTAQVEQISIDEAFLDVSEIETDAASLARQLQRDIQQDLDLPCSLGVASNKLVAKIANDVGKSSEKRGKPPNAITIVPRGEEADFLAPLPVNMLWGIGPKSANKLKDIGILTIGDLAKKPQKEVVQVFGKMGWDITKRAKGIDKRPIVTSHTAKSYSQETTFPRDTNHETELRRTLEKQALKVAARLQKDNQFASTVKTKVRWPDFTTITRQITLDQPTNDPKVIARFATQLFLSVWNPGQAVRLLGVGVSGLTLRPRQLSLWDTETTKQQQIFDVMGELQERFGNNIISLGLHDTDE